MLPHTWWSLCMRSADVNSGLEFRGYRYDSACSDLKQQTIACCRLLVTPLSCKAGHCCLSGVQRSRLPESRFRFHQAATRSCCQFGVKPLVAAGFGVRPLAQAASGPGTHFAFTLRRSRALRATAARLARIAPEPPRASLAGPAARGPAPNCQPTRPVTRGDAG